MNDTTIQLNKDKILNNLNKECININDTEIIENRYLYKITHIYSNLEFTSKDIVVEKPIKPRSWWIQLFCCCR